MTTQTQNQIPLIYAKLSAVMADVAAIGVAKSERNQAQKFNFRSIDQVYNVVTPILAKHGVVAMPEIEEVTRETFDVERVFWNNGQQQRKVVRNTSISLKGNVRFFAEDGSSIPARVVAGSTDGGDKAETQAQSLFMKYGLIHGLMIPVQGMDDGDRVSPDTANVYEQAPSGQYPQQQYQQQPAETPRIQPHQQQQAAPQPAEAPPIQAPKPSDWNLDAAKGHLDTAQTIEALASNWGDIPSHLQSALRGYKDELKLRMRPKTNGSSLNNEYQTQH